MTIRPISAEETVALRWPVLRAGLPRESAVFPGDKAPATCHLGAFDGAELVGVVTIYPAPLPEQPAAPQPWQLRGMAVNPGRQRAGIGRALVQACLGHLRHEGGQTLWCNARLPAAEFYRRAGFAVLGEEFEIPTAGPHFRMARPVAAPVAPVETFAAMAARLRDFRDARDWAQFHGPKELAVAIAAEAGELLQHFVWQSAEQSRQRTAERREAIADEVADVAILLFEFADDLGLDLAAIMQAKLARNELRYPVEKARGSNRKYTEL